ncbi:MAG TPA: class I SAM-dependent methyltransferase [Candidatus Acidoferrales bacterium]|nr:class I SAM-dependent methyltransferase [Candidatus Acidoferrales bacterium]
MISRFPADQNPSGPRKPAWPERPETPDYSPREYWEKLASLSGPGEAEARAVVLHPGAPDWFNRTIDRLQAKAWWRALRRCRLGAGARVLDVGCGTGRWLERLNRAGMAPIGTDRTPAMLGIAREMLPGAVLLAADAQRLPFADASFDCVLAVTVLQHLRWEEQALALQEMARVSRPGAHIVLLDLIRGKGPHIFPRRPEDWIELGSQTNLQRVTWFGQEFIIFDRLVRGAALGLRRLLTRPYEAQSPGLPGLRGSGGERAVPRRLYWLARRVAVRLSVCAEPLAERLCPQSLAVHGVFVFQKPRQR